MGRNPRQTFGTANVIARLRNTLRSEDWVRVLPYQPGTGLTLTSEERIVLRTSDGERFLVSVQRVLNFKE